MIEIKLTLDELNTILASLQELPAKIANPLSNKLVEQAQAQLDGVTADSTENKKD